MISDRTGKVCVEAACTYDYDAVIAHEHPRIAQFHERLGAYTIGSFYYLGMSARPYIEHHLPPLPSSSTRRKVGSFICFAVAAPMCVFATTKIPEISDALAEKMFGSM